MDRSAYIKQACRLLFPSANLPSFRFLPSNQSFLYTHTQGPPLYTLYTRIHSSKMSSAFFSLVLLLPALVSAASNTSSPCLTGTCSYQLQNTTSPHGVAGGSVFLVSLFPYAFSPHQVTYHIFHNTERRRQRNLGSDRGCRMVHPGL